MPLPGGRRESQTDVFVLARRARGLVAIAVEGKVDEAFGPTVAERQTNPFRGVEERLNAMSQMSRLIRRSRQYPVPVAPPDCFGGPRGASVLRSGGRAASAFLQPDGSLV